MNNLKQDIISLLKYYVERESEDERNLIEDQKTRGLTIRLNVLYLNNNTANEWDNTITIHTQLNQLNKEPENNSNCESNSDHFYIKSQKVSHQTRKSSSHSYYNGQTISIETAVTKNPSKCEIVYKTFIYKTEDGKRQQTQRSFTREIFQNKNAMKSSKEMHKYLSRVMENDISNTTHLNNGLNAKDIDNISENKIKNEKPKLKKTSSIKILKSFIGKKDIDSNKNNVINAEKLEPIKKPKKSIKKRLKDWFNRSIVIPDSAIPTTTTENRKKSIIELGKCISTEDSEMEREKPTNIVARISKDTETKNFEIIKDDVPFADEENSDPIELLSSESHCNFNFSNITENNLNDKIDACNCSNRSMEAIINFIISRLNKNKIDEVEINKYNDSTGHFIDCPYSRITSSNGRALSKISTVSSPNSLSPLGNDTPSRSRSGSVISMNSESHLDTVFETIKFSNDIYCPIETINYFMNSKTYEHYEKGLLKVLEKKISLEHMILLFYLTRTIVKQIDDPTCDENDDIKRIMQFSEKFLIKQYYNEISTHGNLEKFILHWDSVD